MRFPTTIRRVRATLAAAGASLLLTVVAGNLLVARADVPPTGATTQPAPRGVGGAFHVDPKTTLEFLAADAQEGRGVGTHGIDNAADLIASDFQRLGLKPLPGSTDYFQPFEMTTSRSADPQRTTLAMGETSYKLGTDFVPTPMTAEGGFVGDVVFVGYGITSKQSGYDDYANVDVKGKVALALRFEPHNEAGTSRFAKDDWSSAAHLDSKAKAAAEHGAVALLLVNPPTFHPGDDLMPMSRMGMGGERSPIPFVQVKGAVASAWLQKATGKDLVATQAEIDQSGKPASVVLAGIAIKGNVTIKSNKLPVKNVMAMLPGAGEHANEYVVIGAHYDHLGYGGMGSLAPGTHAIHHGADDNASGTAAMLMLADRFAHAGPQAKSLVFIAFTAEEEGLIGSAHFVNNPPIPLDKVTAMLNLDMVGRVRNHQILVGGAGTAPSFDAFLKEIAVDSPLKQKSFGRGGMGPSDHMSFALKKVPVLFLFSGLHMDYHRPTDTADKINYAGMDESVGMAQKLVADMIEMPRERYVDAADKDGMQMPGGPALGHAGGGGGSGASLGVVPDYEEALGDTHGVRIGGTVPSSAAERAGLKAGDVLVQFGPDRLDTLQQLQNHLDSAKPGDKVKIAVDREGKRVELEATLSARRGS